MTSVGIDLVEVEEFERSMNRTPDLRHSLFSPQEQKGHKGANSKNLAAWFAAKEAVMKAIWSRTTVPINWHDIIVKHGLEGQPLIELSEELKARFQGITIKNISISISHVTHTAAAVALVEFE
jgi:holo-[acyl-carrier protein] synthase